MVREGTVMPLYQEGLLGPEGGTVRDTRSELPSFPEFFRKVKGSDPSGPLADAYKISGGSRTMLRFITVPPKTPNELLQVIRKAAGDVSPTRSSKPRRNACCNSSR